MGKHKKHSKNKKITFGKTMAAGGEISSTIGVVIAWIMAFIMVLGGIYLISMGIVGRSDIFDSGICSASNPPKCTSGNKCIFPCQRDPNNKYECIFNDPCSARDKSSCNKNTAGMECQYSNAPTFNTASRIERIIGGIFSILFGICIVLFSYWWRRKVYQDKNMAAFAGGITAANVLGSVFGGR